MPARLPLLALLLAGFTPGGPALAQTPLRLGQAVTGRLTPADSQFQDRSHYRAYTFAGSKGDTVTAQLTSDDFDANLILADATGNPLAKNDDGGGSCNARLSYDLPANGTYRLYVNTSARDEIGEFQLSLARGRVATASDTTCRGFGVVTGLVRTGQTVTGELKTDDPTFSGDSTHYQRWILPVETGRPVTIDLRSNDFDAFVLLVTGRGEKLASNDDGAGGCDARVVYKPAGDRPVRVVVNSIGKFQTGKFTLKVTAGALPIEPKGNCRRAAAAGARGAGGAAGAAGAATGPERNIAVGQSVEGRLATSDHYQERDSTYMQGWTIGGTAGQTVTVDLESDEFDPYLFVAGPGIAEPMQDDDSGGNCNARVTLTFPRAGEYLVVVNSSNPRATGRFSLSVTNGAKQKSLARCRRER